jgi:glutathione S-transferase
MPRLLYLTRRSPYARKVALALHAKGLGFEPRVVDLANRSPDFVALSPVNKVPTLVDEDGTVVVDSTVICEYLEDRYPEPPLLPGGWSERLAVRAVEDLGDLLADEAIRCFFARQRGDEAGAEKALSATQRLLAGISERLAGGPRFVGEAFGLADMSVLSALGYLGFRLGPAWREAHPALASWFDAQHQLPMVAATRPAE